jgi:hypothetical protein
LNFAKKGPIKIKTRNLFDSNQQESKGITRNQIESKRIKEIPSLDKNGSLKNHEKIQSREPTKINHHKFETTIFVMPL